MVTLKITNRPEGGCDATWEFDPPLRTDGELSAEQTLACALLNAMQKYKPDTMEIVKANRAG